MSRRIFLAVLASGELARSADEFSRKYSRLPVRWLKSHNLHFTLVPPWYAEDVNTAITLLGRLDRLPAQTGLPDPFDIFLNRVSFGPSPREPRLIWAEGQAPKPMADLKSALERCLGQRPESRPVRLHLTLARFRPENFQGFPVKQIDEQVSWRMTVDSFALLESHLSQSGAEYELLKEFRL